MKEVLMPLLAGAARRKEGAAPVNAEAHPIRLYPDPLGANFTWGANGQWPDRLGRRSRADFHLLNQAPGVVRPAEACLLIKGGELIRHGDGQKRGAAKAAAIEQQKAAQALAFPIRVDHAPHELGFACAGALKAAAAEEGALVFEDEELGIRRIERSCEGIALQAESAAVEQGEAGVAVSGLVGTGIHRRCTL